MIKIHFIILIKINCQIIRILLWMLEIQKTHSFKNNLISKKKYIFQIANSFFEEILKCLKYTKNKNKKYLIFNKKSSAESLILIIYK